MVGCEGWSFSRRYSRGSHWRLVFWGRGSSGCGNRWGYWRSYRRYRWRFLWRFIRTRYCRLVMKNGIWFWNIVHFYIYKFENKATQIISFPIHWVDGLVLDIQYV